MIGSHQIPINRAPRKPLFCKDLLEEIGVVDFRLLVTCDRDVTLDANFFALFLQQASETCVVDAVALDNGHGGGLAVSYPDGWVVLGDMSKGGALDRKSFVFVPVHHQMLVAGRTHGLPDHGMTDTG